MGPRFLDRAAAQQVTPFSDSAGPTPSANNRASHPRPLSGATPVGYRRQGCAASPGEDECDDVARTSIGPVAKASDARSASSTAADDIAPLLPPISPPNVPLPPLNSSHVRTAPSLRDSTPDRQRARFDQAIMSLAIGVSSLDLGRESPPRSRLVPVVAAPIAPLPLPAIPVRASVRQRLL